MRTKEQFTAYIHGLQDTICAEFEKLDSNISFTEDKWEREGGGGGISRIMTNAYPIEKGGVNTSVVHGSLPAEMQQAFGVKGTHFFACGLSLVIHPLNPYVPTVHANWRYFELYNEAGGRIDNWFGGGADLTPYYIFPEDARHFHTTLKRAIQPFGEGLYEQYKKQCDEYFINRHRGDEARGIGGVFYDYLRPADKNDEGRLLAFQRANGNAFINAYFPIVERRKEMTYGEREKEWQEIRRGRYVEFNLIHDRGTLFGLKTKGRTESILMSLPPRARWYYNYSPEPSSEEARLVEALKPRDWTSV